MKYKKTLMVLFVLTISAAAQYKYPTTVSVLLNIEYPGNMKS